MVSLNLIPNKIRPTTDVTCITVLSYIVDISDDVLTRWGTPLVARPCRGELAPCFSLRCEVLRPRRNRENVVLFLFVPWQLPSEILIMPLWNIYARPQEITFDVFGRVLINVARTSSLYSLLANESAVCSVAYGIIVIPQKLPLPLID